MGGFLIYAVAAGPQEQRGVLYGVQLVGGFVQRQAGAGKRLYLFVSVLPLLKGPLLFLVLFA